MIIVIDTETTGLGIINQPRLIQLAWTKYDFSKNLIDYLEAGDSLDEFLAYFPSDSRRSAIAALELAKQMLIASANPT